MQPTFRLRPPLFLGGGGGGGGGGEDSAEERAGTVTTAWSRTKRRRGRPDDDDEGLEAGLGGGGYGSVDDRDREASAAAAGTSADEAAVLAASAANAAFAATELRLDGVGGGDENGGGGDARSSAARFWRRVRESVEAGSFHIHSFDSDYSDEDVETGTSDASSPARSGVGGGGGGGTILDATRHHRIHDRRRRPWERRWRDTDLPYEVTLPECILALLLYLGLGVLAYSRIFERWSVLDSLYFTVVTFTTVGYGDVVPSTRAGRLFTALFAAGGVAFLGVALGALGSRMVEAEVKAVESANREAARRVAAALGRGGEGGSDWGEKGAASASGATSDAGGDERCESARSLMTSAPDGNGDGRRFWGTLAGLLLRYSPALVSLLLGAVIIAKFEGWHVADAVYFCVATAGTIGYGDYVPTHPFARWFAVAFIPLAVAAAGHLLGAVANFIIEQRREAYQRRLWSHHLTLGDLEAMDWDKDGTVSELEYVEFMLLTLKKVDKDLLHQLHSQFQELDVTSSGTLTKRDLQLLAKRRLKAVAKKLQLSSYKYQLLHPEKLQPRTLR